MNFKTKRLLPPKRFSDPELYGGAFSEASIRWYILKAKQMNFTSCIRRVAGKILIDLDEFEAWIDRNGNEKELPHEKD